MTKKIYKNGKIFTEDGFICGGFTVEGDRFGEVFQGNIIDGEDSADLHGAWVIPGLIDVHIHGAADADFSDGDPEGLRRMAAWLARKGVTSFTPASMTLPYDVLAKAYETARDLYDDPVPGSARLMGIHMEGPFFSEKKKGAQNGAYLRLPDYDAFKELFDGCGGLIKIADVAPELEGAEEFTRKASLITNVSVAHTDADYESACKVFDAGSRHLTHLFNAMPPFAHRSPGVIGAASERENVIAELICDGLHVHQSSVRAAFKLFPGRICLISDALRCMGMPDGEYELGGQKVFLKGGVARLEDNTIAGAASDLFTDMKNAISFGIPIEEAITAATLTPAREIRCDKEIGSIRCGKLADFIICDEKLNISEIYIGGDRISR